MPAAIRQRSAQAPGVGVTLAEALTALDAWQGEWSLHRYRPGPNAYTARLHLQVSEEGRARWRYWEGTDPTDLAMAISQAIAAARADGAS